ncbi:MAG: 3-dehydroquinate synthase [Oleiphilaceae bacterium]|nr:3-dehydroquinate synthase [Oleiphilaceae bacterium]
MHKAAHELTVELGERSYPIFIRDGALGQQDLGPWCAGDRVLIVSNETVAPLYMDQARGSFPGKEIDTVVLPDGERFKNWEVLNRIFDTLLDRRHSRRTTLVALGGGVIGDMTGFAAAAYQRGVAFIQIPTSLLAQVDSSVGGKTGINHPLGKNMIGAFHQPEAVLIDPGTLATLPPHQFSAGLAEVIKYGLIRDEPFLAWLEEHVDELMALQPEVLAEAIRRSCECKAQVVAEDERESGVRATLNLGHTFGHAIETHTGYSDWLHGEAVAVGMLMAADLSERLGWLNYNDSVRIRQLLLRVRLPVNPPEGMTPVHFKALMAVDKKNLTGQLRLVLLRKIGEAAVTEDFDPALLEATLDHFCHPLD